MLINVLFYFGNACVIMLLAADACSRMKTFKKWLTEDGNSRKMIRADELFLMVSQVDNDELALTGSNIFALSYSLVAKVSLSL